MNMNKLIKILLVLLLLSVLGSFVYGKFTDANTTISRTTSEYEHLKLRADSARAYCRTNGFSTDYCFLVDFSIHSGKKRFFVWDFKGDSVKYSSLCAHGHGKSSTASKPELAMSMVVIALHWADIRSESVRIANGELMYIINCTAWNQPIAMLTNVL